MSPIQINSHKGACGNTKKSATTYAQRSTPHATGITSRFEYIKIFIPHYLFTKRRLQLAKSHLFCHQGFDLSMTNQPIGIAHSAKSGCFIAVLVESLQSSQLRAIDNLSGYQPLPSI